MSAKQLLLLDDHDIKNSKQLSAPEHESIDQRLKHLKEDVLPFYPFLLTVPSDAPFRLGNRIINDWAVGTDGPFTPEEQQLQYMTFLTHHEGDSLLVAVGDWSDEAGNLAMDHPGPQSAASVTPPSPPGGLAKKRITLNDYKNKRKNDPTSTGQDAGGRDAPTPHGFDPKQRVPKANSAEEDSTRKQPDRKPSPSPARSAAMSRKHPYESQQEQSNSPKGTHSETTAKRRRLSPERATGQGSTDPQSNKLPDLLSPTLPPASGGPSLPRLLSPTLPPDIEKELARFGGESPALEPSWARNTPASTLPKGNAPKKSFSRNSPHSDGTRRLSGIQGIRGQSPNTAHRDSPNGLDRTRNLSPEVPRAAIPSRKRDNSDPGLPSETSRNHLSPADLKANRRPSQERPQLILRLKYGRTNRKRVDGLLKFSGKRKAAQPISPSRERGDLRSPQIKKEGQDYPRLDRESRDGENSRPRDHSKENRTSASKKPPTPASVSQPSTSAPPESGKARKTPAISAKDPKVPTPRTEPAEADDRVPITQAAKSSREFGATAKQLSPHHGGQKSRPQDSERRAWTDEFHRFSNLGRELKHAAQREHQAAKEGATWADEKRAVATSIEAILCFILAFVADDQSRAVARQAGESSKWLSILAYWRVVKGNSRPYPVLRSLCYMLGGVSYDAIHALDLERLAVSPIPGEHMAAPTPGSDGDTVVSDENRKTMKEFLDLKNRLPEFYKESHRLWLEGFRGLSEDIVASEFPSTWSRRSRDYSERGRHQLKVGDYSGEFFLPLSRTSAPIEAVRFAWSILTEWCAKEGVDWKGRLGL